LKTQPLNSKLSALKSKGIKSMLQMFERNLKQSKALKSALKKVEKKGRAQSSAKSNRELKVGYTDVPAAFIVWDSVPTTPNQ
jgi:hypothetical protein|tara:strand:- start:118 stop:363 length:246 start_codon:yes stop_codon:yes gene_type:complete